MINLALCCGFLFYYIIVMTTYLNFNKKKVYFHKKMGSGHDCCGKQSKAPQTRGIICLIKVCHFGMCVEQFNRQIPTLFKLVNLNFTPPPLPTSKTSLQLLTFHLRSENCSKGGDLQSSFCWWSPRGYPASGSYLINGGLVNGGLVNVGLVNGGLVNGGLVNVWAW